MKTSSQPVLAVIREEACIGCTKCIAACPVDAIIGSERLMHTVIASECIGCKLCVPPCPVDCIDLIAAPHDYVRPPTSQVKARHAAREQRLQKQHDRIHREKADDDKRRYVELARARAKANVATLSSPKKDYSTDHVPRNNKS